MRHIKDAPEKSIRQQSRAMPLSTRFPMRTSEEPIICVFYYKRLYSLALNILRNRNRVKNFSFIYFFTVFAQQKRETKEALKR